MKTLLALSFFAASAFAQTTATATIAVTFSQSVLADLNTHWLDQAANIGATAADLDATTASITLSFQMPVTATLAVGNTLLIGSEPMPITSIPDAQHVVVQRGLFNTNPMAAHAFGSTVFVLKYQTPFDMIASEALRPYTLKVVDALGPRSMTFRAAASGSVTLQ